jgi:hypothetical protein
MGGDRSVGCCWRTAISAAISAISSAAPRTPASFTVCGAMAAKRFQKPTSGASGRTPSRM